MNERPLFAMDFFHKCPISVCFTLKKSLQNQSDEFNIKKYLINNPCKIV